MSSSEGIGPRTSIARGATFLVVDLWIVAALAFALILRLTNLDAAPFWLDETETAIWAGLSPAQVFDTIVYRVPFGRYDTRHLPLYFGIVNAWSSLVGHSPWLLRLPSVLFSLASIYLIASLTRLMVSLQAARWAAWLAALSPFLVHTGQEARMYALMGMLAAWSILLAARYINLESRRPGVLFAIANVAALATHYYSVFFVGSVLLTLVLFRPRDWRRWLPETLICVAAIGLVVVVGLFLTQQSSGEIYQFGLFAVPGSLWALVAGYALLPSSVDLHGHGLLAVWPYAAGASLGMIPVGYVAWQGWRRLNLTARALIVVGIGCTVLGPFLVSLVFSKISFNPRYLAPSMPFVLLLLAAGMPQYGAPRLMRLAGIALVAVMLFGTAAELSNPGGKREDLIAAAAWLDANVPRNEEIAVTSDEMYSLALYHWPQRRLIEYPHRKLSATVANARSIAAEMPFSGDRRVYVMGRSWLSDPEGALEAELRKRYDSCGGAAVRGVKILCLRRR